jgi:tetratricopeptide (TPR) repeat protein
MAMDYFRNALKSDSTSLEALYNLGMLYQENGFPDKALETYATMLRFDGKNKLALYNSGYVNLVYLHKYQASADFFTKAIASDTAYADAYYNRAYSFELLGDESKARNDYEKVLELRVNDSKAAEGLSRLDKMRKK